VFWAFGISTPKNNESKTISSLHLTRLHHAPPLRLCASSPVPPSSPPYLAHSPMPQAQLSRGQVDTPSTPRSRHPRLLAPPPDAITSALVAPSFLPPRHPQRDLVAAINHCLTLGVVLITAAAIDFIARMTPTPSTGGVVVLADATPASPRPSSTRSHRGHRPRPHP
jgi:hypothetical protein